MFILERILNPEIMNEPEKNREQEQNSDKKNSLKRMQSYV